MNVEKKKLDLAINFSIVFVDLSGLITFIKRNLPWFKRNDVETIQERGIVQYLCEK